MAIPLEEIVNKPALTPEQWAERAIFVATREGGEEPQRLLYSVEDSDGVLLFKTGCGGASAVGFTRHAIAALALAGTTFGFTWEDVELMGVLAHGWPPASPEAARMNDLAARIAALLPPREGW